MVKWVEEGDKKCKHFSESQPESHNRAMEKDASVNEEELESFCWRGGGYQEKDQWWTLIQQFRLE